VLRNHAYRPYVESVRKRPSRPTITGAMNIGSSISDVRTERPRMISLIASATVRPSAISSPTVNTK
jgi:hypothetical protein